MTRTWSIDSFYTTGRSTQTVLRGVADGDASVYLEIRMTALGNPVAPPRSYVDAMVAGLNAMEGKP